MKLYKNRVKNKILHYDLCRYSPLAGTENNQFIGRLVLDAALAKNDKKNVCVYHFTIQELIDDFIDSYILPRTKTFDDFGQEQAEIIIKDLESMIQQLKKYSPVGEIK